MCPRRYRCRRGPFKRDLFCAAEAAACEGPWASRCGQPRVHLVTGGSRCGQLQVHLVTGGSRCGQLRVHL
eukprot:3321670-Pyramimonas_sp.AAC.1